MNNPIGIHARGDKGGQLRVEVLAAAADPSVADGYRHTEHCLIAYRHRGFETRGARQETRHRHLGLRDGGVLVRRLSRFF